MSYLNLRTQLAETRPDLDLAFLDKAYEFAKRAHKDQLRFSGEPYLIHPVATAELLLALNPDLSTLAAALLHDVLDNPAFTLKEVELEFGTEVAKLVDGLTVLSLVKVRKEDTEAEKWKKMFLALSKDIRIVLIKLAERLHNMQTLEFVPAEKRERIARETLLVHAAIASRLGLYAFKSELEDLCFFYLYPSAYENLLAQVADFRAQAERNMSFAVAQVEQLLTREKIAFERVQGRFKHLWSLYQKMEKKDQLTLDSIYDLFAVRIVLPDKTVNEQEDLMPLYSVLAVIHKEFIPLQGRFKDYVAMPKPNGYRSLHTTVLGLGGDLYDEATEVQIRNFQMHRESELGIASHWAYKLGVNKKPGLKQSVEEQLAYLRGLAEKNEMDLELNLYPDQIFVLTPKREVFELPKGATPIDFAYMVHTDLGNKLLSAKVNGRIVPLDYELRNGELVEIMTRSNVKPNRYWLSIVKTSGARAKIRNWLSKQDKEVNSPESPDLANRELAALSKAEVQEKISLNNLEVTDKILITGEEDLPVVFSACCKPKFPHAVIGYVTRGQSIRIHRLSCRELSGLDGQRFVSAHWKQG